MSVGLPDYYRMNVGTKNVLGKNQNAWYAFWTGDIDANSMIILTPYACPVGFRLYLTGGIVSCNTSCIQRFLLLHTPGIAIYFSYDIRGEFNLHPPIGEPLDAGESLTYYVINDDKVIRTFYITLLGVYEKV